MRSLMAIVAAGGLLAASPLLAQDWKGMGRLAGKVTDTDGKPLANVTVKLDNPERGGGTTVTTDKKGHWGLFGVAAGKWNVDFSLDGYAPKGITLTLPNESDRLPSIDVQLEKAAPAGPGPELAAAAAAADAAYKAGRWAEARAEYEKVLGSKPELTALIEQQIGFTYIQEKDFDKAVEHLDKAVAADPQNQKLRAIAAQAALEGGKTDDAKRLLATLDESAIDSPDVFFNMGVNFLNAGAVPDAILYFGKALKLDPSYVDAYYRRALGYLGQGQTAEAKADFQKVIELQPDGQMAEMSRKALEQIK
jgi:tetratricopeptide (TPR) repeat protein